jgi:precorrin-3B C17-methyltransferase
MSDPIAPKGILSIVGIGPGAAAHMSPAALETIVSADLVVGYITYIKLVRDLIPGKEIIRTGMTEEIGRARAAVERARDGARVAIISSGDAGVYGMAGLVFQVLQEIGWKLGDSPELRLIPGITALNSCASLVGAPLGHASTTPPAVAAPARSSRRTTSSHGTARERPRWHSSRAPTGSSSRKS